MCCWANRWRYHAGLGGQLVLTFLLLGIQADVPMYVAVKTHLKTMETFNVRLQSFRDEFKLLHTLLNDHKRAERRCRTHPRPPGLQLRRLELRSKFVVNDLFAFRAGDGGDALTAGALLHREVVENERAVAGRRRRRRASMDGRKQVDFKFPSIRRVPTTDSSPILPCLASTAPFLGPSRLRFPLYTLEFTLLRPHTPTTPTQAAPLPILSSHSGGRWLMLSELVLRIIFVVVCYLPVSRRVDGRVREIQSYTGI
ncbi:hypothetical protein GALMADRAFT_633482 [Galerina marginata CBS 339.88]|uniref:Uncharacterized protein n=1 Tax=Galerina marginata (strain CBS 339.88) TaxID=685588 RepID=A0A067SSE0_GALM3|nr:hypothetical protein GALMADRAFT_633482 [Galerina marginata CBS 339.88]